MAVKCRSLRLCGRVWPTLGDIGMNASRFACGFGARVSRI
jgi:hypothetical protein